MLTEQYIASTLRPANPSTAHLPAKDRDAGIYLHDIHPQAAQKLTFKKSSTRPHCLAITSTHVFAAQAEKAVIHVYDRSTGKQECLVPFPEKVMSLTLLRGRGYVAGESSNSVLALGMESGQIHAWELGTGRLVSSSAAHLQAVTSIAADPTATFLLSGSADASVHVWSMLSFLSFANNDAATPLHTLARHRAPITAVTMGHSHGSTGIAITASEDKTCIVWAYRTGDLLHTFLLSATPLCLSIDPADRGFVVGQADGSIQLLDFYGQRAIEHSLYAANSTVTEARSVDSWVADSGENTAVCSIAISYDGSKVLSGHENGHVHAWDVGTGKMVNEKAASLIGPVTTIQMLPLAGLTRTATESTVLTQVVKPKPPGFFQVSEESAQNLPAQYILQARFQKPTAAWSSGNSWKQGNRADPLLADFAVAALDDGWTASYLQDDICALQESASGAPHSVLATLSNHSETEVDELHALLARKTEESFEMRARIDHLDLEVVRLRQADFDRKRRHKIKRVRRLEAEELRNHATMATANSATKEAAPGDAESLSESDDLSVGN